MAFPLVDGKFQGFDANGNPLAGGKLYTYAAGTTTPVATYQTSALSLGASNTNPVILDAAGRASVWLTPTTSYRLVLTDSADVPVWDVDNVLMSVTATDTTFTASGSGAVSRTVEAVLRERAVSVKDFGAVGDGVTNDRTAFVNAIATGRPVFIPQGTYYIATSINPAAGSRLMLIGEHRDLVTITSANDQIPFFCSSTPGVDNRINGAFVVGITFDGGHVRTPASYPYNDDAGTSIRQALNLRGVKGETVRSDVVISRCRFQNINGLPVWIADFNGSVEFSFNHLYRTKDPGFLYNDDVRITGNVIEFAADNGISVSRSNKRVIVESNKIRDCASSGIFVGGVFLTGTTGSLTISGAGYTAGATVTVTASANTFTTEDVGISFTLRSGASDRAIVRLTAVASQTSATGVLLRSAPVSLQATATSDWSRGPVSGAQSLVITNNVIDGGQAYGIHMSSGCKDFVVKSNVIRRTGMTCDSEVSTTGTVASGSTTLTLASATNFATGDWIVIEPDYTYEDSFLVQISTLTGTTATLSAAAPQTYVSERVYRAARNTAAYGMLLIGRYETSAIYEYTEQGVVSDNVITDSVTGGIRIGSTSGSVRNVRVTHNQIFLRQDAHTSSTRYGILAGDVGNANMRTQLLDLSENSISLTTASGTSYGVRYVPFDNAAESYLRINENRIRQCTVNVSVVDASSNDLTSAYLPTTYKSPLSVTDQINADTLVPSAWLAATPSAGVLTCTQTLHVLTPASPTTITDINTEAIFGTTPMIILRNASATNALTFTFNASKIRTLTGADVTVPAYGAITFVAISTTLVQQV